LIEVLQLKLTEKDQQIENMVDETCATNDFIQKVDVTCNTHDLMQMMDVTHDTNRWQEESGRYTRSIINENNLEFSFKITKQICHECMEEHQVHNDISMLIIKPWE